MNYGHCCCSLTHLLSGVGVPRRASPQECKRASLMAGEEKLTEDDRRQRWCFCVGVALPCTLQPLLPSPFFLSHILPLFFPVSSATVIYFHFSDCTILGVFFHFPISSLVS